MSIDRTTPPPVSCFSDIYLQPEKIVRLDNGIDLHLVRKGNLPISRVALVFDGGTNDFSSAAATAVMAETICEGTSNKSGSQIADLIDFTGSRLGGVASNHNISMELVAINSNLTQMAELMCELATNASFPSQAVASAARRLSAFQALQMQKVSAVASKHLGLILKGPCHPDAIVPAPEDFETVNSEICRSLFSAVSHSRKHIFAGGDLSDNDIEKLCDTLSSLPPSGNSLISFLPFEPAAPCRQHIEMPDSKQWAAAFGLPVIDRNHPDFVPLRLTVMALGGYFGSRLMSNIREEKGLTYGINASIAAAQEGAYMEITAQCDKRYVNQVIDETIKEITNLSNNPPQGKELQRLKLNAWTTLASSADNAFGTLQYYITIMKVGAPYDYFQQQLKTIESITPDDIAMMADKYLRPDKLSIVTVGE